MLNNLTAEQKNILQTVLQGMGLAADIARATITVFLPGTDKKFLYIYKQIQPNTVIMDKQADLTGKKVRCVEEPLVARSLQQNIAVAGKRESKLGIFNSFSVYPLRDINGKCFGVISFDAYDNDEIMLREALELLRNVKSDSNYGRLSPDDGLLIVNPDKVIISANSKARHIMQVLNINDLLGRRINDVAINWPLVGMVIDTGIAESKQFTMHGRLLSIKVLPVIPKPKRGCAVVILQDITELHKKDEELLIKSVVIKEIHHRVKNNLQTIVSLLRLQERRTTGSEAKEILKDCIGRVNSIAVVHEYLSQQDTGMVDVSKVIRSIYQEVAGSMLQKDFVLRTDLAAYTILLNSEKVISIALILNELLQNIIEHAFKGKNSGEIKVRFTDMGNCYNLLVTDNGRGLPENFKPGKDSLGLKIITTMAEADLHGSFSLADNSEGGVTASVVIPKSMVE